MLAYFINMSRGIQDTGVFNNVLIRMMMIKMMMMRPEKKDVVLAFADDPKILKSMVVLKKKKKKEKIFREKCIEAFKEGVKEEKRFLTQPTHVFGT